jgi:uncharacterized protein (TIGR02271 family)
MARAPLSQLDDWELVDDDQDIRGWPVQDRDGNRLGTVRELIIDTDTELVEVIVLDNGQEYPNDDVELGRGVVYLRRAEIVEPVVEPVETVEPVEAVETDATRIPRYEEELAAEKTAREAGEVRISKDVVEEEQTLEVPVAREAVRVRRRVVDRPAVDTSDAFRGEGEIAVPVREEGVEVTKGVRVAEELEVSREAVQETEAVTDTVRKERIDVEQEGDVEVQRGDRPER